MDFYSFEVRLFVLIILWTIWSNIDFIASQPYLLGHVQVIIQGLRPTDTLKVLPKRSCISLNMITSAMYKSIHLSMIKDFKKNHTKQNSWNN